MGPGSGERRSGQEAVGQVIAFLVAGTVFVGSIGALLLASNDAEGDEEPVDEAGRTLQAASLASLLADSRGIGWELGADGVSRLGLQAENGSGLDLALIDKLRGATEEPDPDNGLVDYEEALRSLGLEDGTRFHLRIYPVGPFEESLSLDGLRVGYVGDWVTLPNVKVTLSTQAAMLASAQAKLDVKMATDAQRERQAIAALGVDYTNTVHLTAALPKTEIELPLLPDPPLLTALGLSLVAGDVYPDDKTYLTAVLPSRLSEYDALIIGTGADHQALTSNAVKNGIRDWVLAGGTLIVLGSDSSNYEWLTPLFHVGVRTVNGGPLVPDVAHPLLLHPNDLDWESYDSHGLGWDIKSSGSGAHYDDFTHVITEGDEDVLAVSNDGGFGDGRIFVTTYRPGEISRLQGADEAEAFIENMLLYSENNELYLEYGPRIPTGLGVATAMRQTQVWDPTLGDVQVRVEVHVWQDAPLS